MAPLTCPDALVYARLSLDMPVMYLASRLLPTQAAGRLEEVMKGARWTSILSTLLATDGQYVVEDVT